MWCFSIPISGGRELPLPRGAAQGAPSLHRSVPVTAAAPGQGRGTGTVPWQPRCRQAVCDRHGSQVTLAGPVGAAGVPGDSPALPCPEQDPVPGAALGRDRPGLGLLQLGPPALPLAGWALQEQSLPLQQPRLCPAVSSWPGWEHTLQDTVPGSGRCHRSSLTPDPCLSLKGLVCTHQGTRRTSMN